ncbi:MAG: hypothetical protein JXA13_05325 [Anaerolineales bacterium]|nr:hypothetical protein [Anaerolineales bacterium]
MLSFFLWYLIVTLLGWVTFPLVYRLFPALKDRGYGISRAAGLFIWGYLFWIFTSFGLTQNDNGGILLAGLVLLGLSFLALTVKTESNLQELRSWMQSNRKYILAVEILFLLAFGFIAVYRAANQELYSAEKPMELAFISAIMRSPSFPPSDPWLSGYAISYYYFGYVITAMLAQLSAVPSSVAHNLMTSLVFGLSAVGAYSILFNLLAGTKNVKPLSSQLSLSYLGPLFLLLVSNFEGFLEVLHRRGFFWVFSPDGSASSAFWEWLKITDLISPPAQPLKWTPDRHWWWWQASRVIRDYDLLGNPMEVIDEFPFFSFLHADLHPHVLALPFGMLALAVALNVFLGGWRDGKIDIAGWYLRVNKTGFLFSALLLGGIAFLNTWDILVAMALVAGAYVLSQVRIDGWSWKRMGDFLLFSIPVGVLAFLLYLPFYLGFSSQAGGPMPNLIFPTRGVHLWVIFGPLFLPIFGLLLYLMFAEKRKAAWNAGFGWSMVILFLLWETSWLMALRLKMFRPDVVNLFLQTQGITDIGALFVAATQRRGQYIGGLVTMMTVLILGIAYLVPSIQKVMVEDHAHTDENQEKDPVPFVLLLVVLGGFMVLVPDFIYLQDVFASRLNTVFKFYYQSWQLWSLAAAFGVAVLLSNLRGVWDRLWRVTLVVMLCVSLTYPVLGILDRTNKFNPYSGWTLDGAVNIRTLTPNEMDAIDWLRKAPYGVVAEAVESGPGYSSYARISTYTGLPTVLGWTGHEVQWRGTAEPQGSRMADIQILYSTPDWETTKMLIDRYNIRYIYIGYLERMTYNVREEKFASYLEPVFTQGEVNIYEVP